MSAIFRAAKSYFHAIFMRKYLSRVATMACCWCCLSLSALAQWSSDNLFFELDFAAEIPTGQELREVFPPGANMRAGLEINTWAHRLYLKPNGGISFFNNYYSVSGQETLLEWSGGIDARYYLRTVNDTAVWNFYPVVGASYRGFSNTIGPQPGFVGNTRTLTRGHSIAYAAGGGFLYRRFHAEITYNGYQPIVRVDEQLAADLNANSGLYQPYVFHDTKMDFSRVRIEIGLRVPIK